MSICKHCGGIGGYHKAYCPVPHVAKQYSAAKQHDNQSTEPKES